MDMRKFLLIRHGETDGNQSKRYIGKTDEGLASEGKTTVLNTKRIVDEWLASNKITVTTVYSSPMKRAKQTAEMIFPDAELIEINDLREIDFGDFEYKNYDDLKDDPRYQAYIDSNGEMRFPNGESKKEFQQRSCEAYEKIIKDNPDEKLIVIVAHGGTIMAIMDRFTTTNNSYFDYRVSNAEGFINSIDESGKIIDEVRICLKEQQ